MPKDIGKKILFSGYAKLPEGITDSELYKVLGLIVLIDADTDTIEEVDCTLASELARKHISAVLSGYKFNHGPEALAREIDMCYHGSAKKAIIAAIHIIYDKYQAYKQGKPVGDLPQK